jgi:multidrug efflux pump subunit AcrB
MLEWKVILLTVIVAVIINLTVPPLMCAIALTDHQKQRCGDSKTYPAMKADKLSVDPSVDWGTSWDKIMMMFNKHKMEPLTTSLVVALIVFLAVFVGDLAHKNLPKELLGSN